MVNFTSNTYQLKREILTFSNKISRHLSKPDKKFTADMTYGMLASGSCLLTDITDQLHEDSKSEFCGTPYQTSEQRCPEKSIAIVSFYHPQMGS